MKYYTRINPSKLLTSSKYIKKNEIYADDIICFDTETTSCWLTQDGRIVPDCNLYAEKWYNEQMPIGFVYEWTMSINSTAFYGRNLEDAIKVFKKINKDGVKRCVFVHNLAFEFVFLSGLMKVQSAFARQSRHPMKVVFDDCENLEFRCTYMLTRMSLAEWGKAIGKTQKQKGYDYSKIRTPNTLLTEKELVYCEDDVLVMHDGLREELKTYKHVSDIPLTQTGKVRREIKKILATPQHLRHMANLTPDYDLLRLLYYAYWGGYTHGNYTYIGEILHDVESWDYQSSYPYCMVCLKYPMTPWKKVNKIYDTKKYCYLIRVKFKKIKSKRLNTFLSASKCISHKKVIRDNGRIMSADFVELCMSDLDYEIFKKCYDFEEEEIVEIYESKKGYLPREFIIYILQLFKKKTELKDIPERSAEYRVSKEYINALYGMLCTAIIFDDLLYLQDDGVWKINENTESVVRAYLEDLKSKPTKKNFLSFSWGVWVIAHARYNLWSCILRCDEGNIYDDTDSLKVFKEESKKFVSWYNKKVLENIKASAKTNNIPISMFMPYDKHGKQHIIGQFDNDGHYSEFVTLGAKRYCYRSKDDGNLHITVSGVPKGAVIGLNDDIRNFKDGFVFDRSLKRKDFKKCVSSTLYYIHNQPKVTINKGRQDEYTVTNPCGVAIRRKSYTMGVSEDFLNFLIRYKKDKKGCETIERIRDFEKN